MLEEPIRKKNSLYPKDFTPSVPPRTAFSQNKHSIQEQFSFSAKKNHTNRLNLSTQFQEDTKEEGLPHLFTINPEEARTKNGQPEHQSPLMSHRMMRRAPHINPHLLSKTKVQQNPLCNLHVLGESDLQTSFTPGSIKKNINQLQQPLNQERPDQTQQVNAEPACKKQVSQNANIFQDPLRAHFLNYTKSKAERLASFRKRGASQAEGTFKTVKKNFSFSSNKSEEPMSSSNLFLRRGASEEKKSLLGFGYLLQESKVRKLKGEINQMAQERTRSKNINGGYEDISYEEQSHCGGPQINMKKMRKRKVRSGMKLYPELGGKNNHFVHEENHSYEEDADNQRPVRSSLARPIGSTALRKYKISFKTSLGQLNQIYSNLRSESAAKIELTVPHILLNLNIDPRLDKSALYNEAINLFQSLGIPVNSPSIKRYSNCVLFINDNVCLLIHYSGKVYLGGWKAQYLDQGVKHGLGLEWLPNKYVYYGQFGNNKKEGLGVMKNKSQTFFGMWKRGTKMNEGLIVGHSGEVNWVGMDGKYSQSEEDPFL